MDPSREESIEVSKLIELTSDAIAICGRDGTIGYANKRMLGLVGHGHADVLGSDIKDILFSEKFERAEGHSLPFPLDGSPSHRLLKLADGSFIPVEVRAVAIDRHRDALRPKILKRLGSRERIFVALRSLEEQYARDRQMRRVLAELKAANKRLSGTLSVIMATVGADDLNGLLDTVLNRLVDALDADGTTFYVSEGGGFKLRGVSQSLAHAYVPEYIPFGAGVPTHVARASGPCRLSIMATGGGSDALGTMYDHDRKISRHLRLQDIPPFKTMIAVPVFFGRQVLGVCEVGWNRQSIPRRYNVNVLEVVCDYLSIELVSLASSLRARRSQELTHSLNHVRDVMYSFDGDHGMAWAEVAGEIKRVLGCHLCPVVLDDDHGCYAIDYEGSRVLLPGDIDRMFFSTTAPAARVAPALGNVFAQADDAAAREDELTSARLTRIDRLSWASNWLASNGLPSQGVFCDFGSLFADADLPAGDEAGSPDASSSALMTREGVLVPRMLMLLRDGHQEPIDDIEYDYLVRLIHELEQFQQSASQSREDRHIAQALQAGMRSSLGSVPGIASDSLYSSATQQALVGGDFYTLMQLPDNQAVMILGDVSGKGIEAASMSAFVKTALSAYAWEGMDPVRMVRSLNSMLMSFSRVETFATMFVAKIDLALGRAVYCSAGHPPTMLVRKASLGPDGSGPKATEIVLLSKQSGVVGAFEGMAYEEGSFSFAAGDILFMYTDGAIEARDPAGEFYGEERLRARLLAVADAGVQGLCERVLSDLDRFSSSSLEDDIALVALQFEEPRAPGRQDGPSRD